MTLQTDPETAAAGQFLQAGRFEADEQGWFGGFGGRFMPEALIAAHGAVSAQTARAMALGARMRLGTTHAVATTGIAIGSAFVASVQTAGLFNAQTLYDGLLALNTDQLTLNASMRAQWLKLLGTLDTAGTEMLKLPVNAEEGKYNVIIRPGDGDISASRSDVKGTYLLIH